MPRSRDNDRISVECIEHQATQPGNGDHRFEFRLNFGNRNVVIKCDALKSTLDQFNRRDIRPRLVTVQVGRHGHRVVGQAAVISNKRRMVSVSQTVDKLDDDIEDRQWASDHHGVVRTHGREILQREAYSQGRCRAGKWCRCFTIELQGE